MARRVYVHIGTMKSATSYLQELFDDNRDVLAAQGLLWTRAEDYFLATSDLFGSTNYRLGLEGAWERLNDELTKHDGDALVSNELLAQLGPRKRTLLVEELAPAETHLVLTARDLGRVVPSQWQTGARNRNTVTWADFVAAVCGDGDSELGTTFWRRHDVAEIIARWQRDVPLERITLVTVPPSGAPFALVGERFATAVGVDGRGFTQPPYSNPSVGAYSAQLLRRISERTTDLDFQHHRWGFKSALSRYTLALRADAEPPIALRQDELDRIGERARTMIDRLRTSGVRVVGDLDDLVPATTVRGPVVDPGATSVETLFDTALDGLVGLGQIIGDMSIEHDMLMRDLDELFGGGGDRAPEFAAFVAYEASLPQAPPETMVMSRYLRWRLRRLLAEDGGLVAGRESADGAPARP